MYRELKRAILRYLLEHEKNEDRKELCEAEFSPYIWNVKDPKRVLIGGEEVRDFISRADILLYYPDEGEAVIHKDLRKEIVEWLCDNEQVFSRVVTCYEAFRPYIYDEAGNYCIGGKDTANFIKRADALLYAVQKV